MRIACSVEPRAIAAAQGPRAEADERDFEAFRLDGLHAPLFAFGVVGKPRRNNARRPVSRLWQAGDHRIRHGALQNSHR